MTLALQIAGGTIVALALLQAATGLFAEVNAALRRRRMDYQRLSAFIRQTEILVKRAETDRRRTELTWAGNRKFKVLRRTAENRSGDICSFYLVPHDGGALPPFEPGQFLTFTLNIPDQSAPVVRCYSLSDSPTETGHYRVTIKKLPPPPNAEPGVPAGLSSGFFHDLLSEGDVIDVAAPNGAFHLDTASDRPIVLIGGGVGLTPVLSMLKWIAATGSRRETWFFYAVRNNADIALRDEIRAIADNAANIHAVIVYSNPTDDCVAGRDYDEEGFLTTDLLKRHLGSSNYEFYICGPPPMMEALTGQLYAWGVPEADVRFEAFGPASVKKTTPRAAARSQTAGAVKVEFTRSKRTLMWEPEAGTLLELADANGLRINAGCRAGNCGTCATALRQGSVNYLTKPARPPEQGSALLCIACPDGDVVLDA